MRILVSFLVAISVSKNQGYPTKLVPSYGPKIENREVKVITDEYFKLSARNHIKFDKNVSIGFSKITKESVIGFCSYRPGFREIDLDGEYWDSAKWLTKVALLYHEMTHCYCGRNHDFGLGTMYPDGSLRWLIDNLLARQPLTPLKPPGYLEDGCPQSIMHPIIIENSCFKKHYSYYVEEMFSRCEPY